MAALVADGSVSARTLQQLGQVSTATLAAQLHRRGYTTVTIEGVRTNKPGAGLVGVARTLRLIPFRADLFASHGGGYNAQKRIFDDLATGEVLVIEARGVIQAGTLGDVLAARAAYLGATGIVTDGCVRDASAVADFEIPTFSAAPHPALIGRHHVPWAVDETISCGGAAVQPGDVIVGDDDGALVVPPLLADEIASAAVQQELEERFISEMVTHGERIEGLYPMNDSWRSRFDEWDRRRLVLEES